MAAKIPDELFYLPTHQWVRINGDIAEIGITDFAQQSLGDITWVELPEVGKTLARGENIGDVESVKAVSEVPSPLAGEVIAVNEQLADAPELCNRDPYGSGWLVKIRLAGEPEDLLDPGEYARHCEQS